MAKVAAKKKQTKQRARPGEAFKRAMELKRLPAGFSLFPEIAHLKKRRFLTALAIVGTAAGAGRLIGVDERMHWIWLKNDPEYAAATETARKLSGQRVEDTLWKLGVEGADKPIIWNGEITGTYKEHSVTALIFLAKGNNPEKYRETVSVEHQGKITHQHVRIETIDPFAMAKPIGILPPKKKGK